VLLPSGYTRNLFTIFRCHNRIDLLATKSTREDGPECRRRSRADILGESSYSFRRPQWRGLERLEPVASWGHKGVAAPATPTASSNGSEAAQAIEHTVIHLWGTDPLKMGSYSVAKVGKVSARTTLAQPIDDRLYFAGEAITENAHSSLHGAFLTGQAAAQGIFDALNGSQ
jgi:hypothetical protein